MTTAFVKLTNITCGKCAGTYALDETYRAEKYQTGGHWNCPYCQVSWGYGKGQHEVEVERLKKELADQMRFKEWAQKSADDAQAEADHFRKSRDGMKGKLVSVQRRVKNGVCPCCTRTFGNLARHMASKHPDFTCEKVEGTDSAPAES